MSGSQDDMDDIVQSFVSKDLASLDRIGGEPDSFTLSPHLTEESPILQQQSPHHASTSFASNTSNSARQGPELLTPAPPTKATHELPDPPEAGSPAGSRTDVSPQKSRTRSDALPPAGSRQQSGHSSVRNASTSSTASVSTQEREKRGSLGDKFKLFGKRITSGSKK